MEQQGQMEVIAKVWSGCFAAEISYKFGKKICHIINMSNFFYELVTNLSSKAWVFQLSDSPDLKKVQDGLDFRI